MLKRREDGFGDRDRIIGLNADSPRFGRWVECGVWSAYCMAQYGFHHLGKGYPE